MNFHTFSCSFAVIAALILSGCSKDEAGPTPAPEAMVEKQVEAPEASTCEANPKIALSPTERLISIVGTNDMHGAIMPKESATDKKLTGGMAFFAGAMKAIRDGVSARYGKNGGVLLVDGGDQFQGTLLSNYSEGSLMFSLMNEAGYDAVVPGNHDYDFGPFGWLIDQVTPTSEDKDPRSVIKSLASSASFPLLSANTYLKASLKTIEGKDTSVDNVGCAAKEPLDWSKATRPDFLKPYAIKEVAGVRVAMIGLDNPETPKITAIANVSDLCFRSALEEYQAIRSELEGKADVFTIVIHDGDINKDTNLTNLLTDILAWRADGVDAIVGGHTHVVNKINVNNVYAIQSGANGDKFGRIDLVYDSAKKKVIREKTRVAAGAVLHQDLCDPLVASFCSPKTAAKVMMECEPVQDSEGALAKIADAQKKISGLAGRVLGTAPEVIKRERDQESPLVNLLSDTLRKAVGSDIAMINTGGVRANLAKGPVTYEDIYQVVPFNNRTVLLKMKTSTLVKLMRRSAQSCGRHGSVLASGIRGTFRRGPNCVADASGLDPKAALLTLNLVNKDGTESVLYDERNPANVILNERELIVATLDFLSNGGSGFDAFKEATPITDKDPGLFRELVADELGRNPTDLPVQVDGRWKDQAAAPAGR